MTLHKYFSALMILGALTLSAPARADIPPDDQCSASMVGKSCSNARSDGNAFQLGVCNEARCTRATPDGSMTYTCYRCEPVEQAAGGQPNEAGEAGAAGAKGGSINSSDPKTDSDDDGGCSVSQARGGAAALGAALALLSLVALGMRRRRSLRA